MSDNAFPGEYRFLAGVVACGVALAVWAVSKTGAMWWLVGYTAGLVFCSYGLAMLRRCRVASRWNDAEGRMLEAGIESVFVPDEATNTEYRPKVLYEYGDGNGFRTGGAFSVSPSLFRVRARGEISNLLLSYRPGTRVSVKVCPTATHWAVLRTDMHPRRRSHTTAIILSGVLVMAFSVVTGAVYAP